MRRPAIWPERCRQGTVTVVDGSAVFSSEVAPQRRVTGTFSTVLTTSSHHVVVVVDVTDNWLLMLVMIYCIVLSHRRVTTQHIARYTRCMYWLTGLTVDKLKTRATSSCLSAINVLLSCLHLATVHVTSGS